LQDLATGNVADALGELVAQDALSPCPLSHGRGGVLFSCFFSYGGGDG
jgi:hypothetical protein